MPGLQAFASEYPQVPAYCLCTTPRPYVLSGVRILPWTRGPELLRSLA